MLKVGDYVNIEGISKELFDALVAKAVACGFKDNDGYHVNNVYEYKFRDLFINEDVVLDVANNALGELKNELTINEWLFAGAPNEVTELRLVGTGNYYYVTDGMASDNIMLSTGFHGFDKNSCIDKAKVIATRKPASNDPVVGEEYLITDTCLKETYKGRVLYKGLNWIVWLRLDNGEECCQNACHVKIEPLPQYTDEQLAAYDLYKSIYPEFNNSLDSLLSERHGTYDNCLNAIKAGWSKK